MIKIKFNERIYNIKKEKIIFILEKLNNKKINENEIETLMEKYKLYDEYFLKSLSELS